jgi:hypothetical protein
MLTTVKYHPEERERGDEADEVGDQLVADHDLLQNAVQWVHAVLHPWCDRA